MSGAKEKLLHKGNEYFVPEDEDDEKGMPQQLRWRSADSSGAMGVVKLVGFLTSVVLNVILVLALCWSVYPRSAASPNKTSYAGLDFSKISTWEASSPYTGPNISAADATWLNVDIDHAFVAITKEHSSKLGLLPSLDFPWDPEEKSLYLINGIHSLHCLQILHQSNLEYRTDHTQTYETEHLLHCLNNLRMDIECFADDSLRFVPTHAHVSTVATGIGQPRQCRDWSRLHEWAEENSACFNYHEFARSELAEEFVYPSSWSYCHKDSEYVPTIQDYYHKPADWFPTDSGTASKDNLKKVEDYGESKEG